MDPPPPPPPPPRPPPPAAVDLLSSLPEPLLDEILTRLGLRDAVRTSAISRAWRRRWETIIGLALSFPNGTPLSAIDSVLRRYAGPSVSRFACHVDAMAACYRSCVDGWLSKLSRRSVESHVDDWLIALSRRSVESISIVNNNYRFRKLILHTSIFSCDRLVSLSLEMCWIPPLPQPRPGGGFAGFPVLKELYLTHVQFAANTNVSQFEAMLRASPMLRVLLLEEVMHFDLCGTIEGPNIHTLGLISRYIHSYWRLGDLPCLQYASIDSHNVVEEGGPPARCLEFLAGVSQVQQLILNLPLCYFKMDEIPFTFSNLKSMELSTEFAMHGLSLMFCLLSRSPNLEKLKIQVRLSHMIINNEFQDAQWIDGMCANLQVLQIISYRGWLPLSFIKCILSKASLLRTLSVDGWPVSQYDRLSELLNCRRASPHAQVRFKVQLEKISFNHMKFAEKRLKEQD